MATITGNSGDNSLSGTTGNNRIFGLAGNDTLDGRAGHDRLEGGDGRDTLRGRLGNDLLLGGAGNDILYGGDGRDILVGGLGRDIMYGGAGPDVFRFDDRDAGDISAGPLSDVIRDFSENDVLDLTAVDVLYFSGYGSDPSRASFSYWVLNGNTYVSWNTFGSVHDIELTGFTGDVFNQIRWYDDDYLANENTTGRIAAGQTRTGVIEVDQDRDWFRITLVQDRMYTFNLRGEDSGAGTLRDPGLSLHDDEGEYVTGENVDTGTNDARLQFYAQEAGTYYISADGSGYTTGTYRLGVTAETVIDDYAGNTDTTGEIAPGQTRAGKVDFPEDEDWFRITLTEGETYTIDLRGQDSGSGTLPDPYLVLRDADGDFVDANDDADSLDSQLVHTASVSGTYYIVARELGSGIGTYELSVSDPLLMI